jgi:hypothetical protein
VTNVIRHPSSDPADDDGLNWEATPTEAAPARGFERIPPQDLDAEQCALGGMLLSHDVIAAVADVLGGGTDFYRPAHTTIYTAILRLHAQGEPADPITVAAELGRTGDLQRAGGMPYLHGLVNAVPTAANAEYYAGIVQEQATLRRLVEAGTAIAAMGYAADGDVNDIVEHARKTFEGAATLTAHGPAHLAAAILDWDEFFATDFGSVRLLPGRLMAPGQQITLVGDGKAGKSLFAQEWMWRMATGRPFLGDDAADPLPILYLDAENGREQIQERIFSFGGGPGGMGLLRYASFPPVRPLDTAGGGADLMNLVQATGAQLVVIDTVSRFISGAENDADTWLSLYRHTLMPLKSAGIASVRLDHFGKDKDRGGRGSSAKNQDVDHVWELSAQGGGMLSLRRTHTRTGIGPDEFAIRREAHRSGDAWVPGHTRHVAVTFEHVEQNLPGTPEYIIMKLDGAGVPRDAGRDRLRTECLRLNIAASNGTLSEVAKIRKARSGQVPGQVGDRSDLRVSQTPLPEPAPRQPNAPQNQGNTGQDTPQNLSPDLSPTNQPQPVLILGTGTEETPDQTCPGQVEDRSGQAVAGPVPMSTPRSGGQGDGQPAPLCVLCDQPITNAEWVNRGYDRHHVCPTGFTKT